MVYYKYTNTYVDVNTNDILLKYKYWILCVQNLLFITIILKYFTDDTIGNKCVMYIQLNQGNIFGNRLCLD